MLILLLIWTYALKWTFFKLFDTPWFTSKKTMWNSNRTNSFFHNNIKIGNTIYENIHFNNSQFSHRNLHFVLYIMFFYLLSHPWHLQYSVQCSSLQPHTFVQPFLQIHLVTYWVGIICRYLLGSKIPFTDFHPRFNGECIELLWWRSDCSRVRQKLTK